jgi:hypothetical protein
MVERATQKLVDKHIRTCFMSTQYATLLKKVDDRFHNNFATCLKMHLLFYRDVNLGFTTNNQKKERPRTMARMTAKGHVVAKL